MGGTCRSRQGALRSAAAAACAWLLLLAGAEAARPMPKLTEPDYTIYHTKEGVFKEVQEIVASCPSIMKLSEENMTADGNYTSTLTVVTVEPGGHTDDHASKLRLLLNFGEHGRELISSEIGLRLLRLLCSDADRGPFLDTWSLDRAHVEALLRRAVFKIVPMENVRGREKVEAGELCLRKNGRGVDPNRNWDVHWGVKEKDYDPNEEYPGTAPFSEPEAGLLLGLAKAVRPHVWASVHSGMAALFMPYDHQDRIPEGAGPAALLDILKQLNTRTCGGKCAVGSGGKSVGYLAHGTATDYMYTALGVPVSMTWEVYGDSSSPFEDCFRMFNPLTRPAYTKIVEQWTAAFFHLLALLLRHPDLAQELALPVGGGGGNGAAAAAGGDAASVLGGGGGLPADGGAVQQQQQQPGSAAREVQGGAAAQDGSGGAAEIAAALLAASEGQQQEQGGELAAAALTPQSRSAQLLYWAIVLATGGALASYLWSKPRLRYQLSTGLRKWVGSRRRAGLIPL